MEYFNIVTTIEICFIIKTSQFKGTFIAETQKNVFLYFLPHIV